MFLLLREKIRHVIDPHFTFQLLNVVRSMKLDLLQELRFYEIVISVTKHTARAVRSKFVNGFAFLCMHFPNGYPKSFQNKPSC